MNTVSLVLLHLSFCLRTDTPQALSRYSYVEPHMGTHFKIVLYAPDKSTADRAAQATFLRIAALDAMMSDYKPDSELMQLCRNGVQKPIRVSDELFFVLERAQKVSEYSDGAFDITVGPVVRLWRRARKSRQLPDPAKLADALKLVGYKNVRLDRQNKTVQLLKPGMQLDLGGIAKGYAADIGIAVLKSAGITSALVAAGGDIAVSDPPPRTNGWKIGIAELENPGDKPQLYIQLANAAVSTSGDAEQYLEINGKRYSHLVDPKTGIGLVGRQSATVVAPRGIMADSLTKVVSVLGPKRGFEIIDGLESAASLVVKETDKGIDRFESKRFREFIQPEASPP
jgi:thiamine biosynthesis lipoprotein